MDSRPAIEELAEMATRLPGLAASDGAVDHAARRALLALDEFLPERQQDAALEEQARRELHAFLREDLVYFFQKSLTREFRSAAVNASQTALRRVSISTLKELGVFVLRAPGRDYSRLSLTEEWYLLISDGQCRLSLVQAIDYFALLRNRLYSFGGDQPFAFRNTEQMIARLLSDEPERPGFAELYRAERLLRELLLDRALLSPALQAPELRAIAARLIRSSTEHFLESLHQQFERAYLQLLAENKRQLLDAEERSKAIATELRAAARVHRKHLQRDLPAQDERVRFALWYQPHGDTDLSGDYYMVERLDEDSYAIVLADIAGHGLSGAIHIPIVRAALERHRDRLAMPDRLMDKLNQDLFGQITDAFVTAVAVHLDLKKGRVRYCNAGHTKGFLVLRREDRTPVRFLRPNSRVLGAFEKSEFRNDDLYFDGAARLALYTDGLSEMATPGGEMLGERDLLGFFRGTTELPTEQVVGHVRGELDRFRGAAPALDDCTLLLTDIKWLQAAPATEEKQ